MMSYGDIPRARQRLFRGQPAAAAWRHHRRRSRQGAGSGHQGPGADAGIRHPLLVQVSRRNQGLASVGRRHRTQLPAGRSELQGHAHPDRGRSTNRPSIPGSRRRAGAATPMEVGPLSRMVLGYVQPKQYPFIKDTIDAVLKKLDVPVTALFSTLGRTAARGIEALYCRPAAVGAVRQADGQSQGRRLGDGQCREMGSRQPGRRKPRAWVSPKRRAARWGTG